MILEQRSLADVRAEQEFVQYITGIGFEWLLETNKIEVPLVLAQEFFTTFRFQHSAGVMTKSIQFRVFGRMLRMNLTEWSVRLGLYTEKQAEAGVWLGRDMGQPTAIKEFNCQSTWESITANAPPYNATSSRGSWINHPVLSLAQVFLRYNLLAQENATSPISPTELYLMWCMKEQRKVHLGYWLAHTCHMIAVHPERNLTACHILGEFLKRNLNICFEGIAPPPPCPPPGVFNIVCFVKAKLVRMVGGRYCFYDIGESKEPLSPPHKTLTITDKPEEGERTTRESTPAKKKATQTQLPRAGEPRNYEGEEGASKRNAANRAVTTGEEGTAAWMRRIEELIRRLVESSTAHQATMVIQATQMTKAVRSLEATLKQINDHHSPFRSQERGVITEVTRDSNTPHTLKRPRPDDSPPIRSNILPPHQRPREHKSTSSSRQQYPPRLPPEK